MESPWRLVLAEEQFEALMAHLFPGDGDEHGAVIGAGIARSPRGVRLLVRDLFLAREGIDFVPGTRGYRRLTPQFVRERIAYCRDQGLVYLAVHNHGGNDRVEFSSVDNHSHERGYPALLDISGCPVGALVLAPSALAGDIWTPDRMRRRISETIIVGRNLRRLYPSPPPQPPRADPTFDRQVRWFGDRGQLQLGRMKVGVIGAGGVGLPLVTMLGRMGVGEIVVVDPDRVVPENLPRLAEARRIDAMTWLHRMHLHSLAKRLSIRKVALGRRAVRRANRRAIYKGIPLSVIEPLAVREITDCDFIFLAADSHQARLVFNAVVHQYLIPGIQLGSRIEVEPRSGQVGDIRCNVRLVLPETGCLRCNHLISPSRLQDESRGATERERNRYVDEIPAPSVITLNTAIAAQAANDLMMMVGGLVEGDAPLDYLRYRPRQRRWEPVRPLPNKASCSDCGNLEIARRARGDLADLPLPERA